MEDLNQPMSVFPHFRVAAQELHQRAGQVQSLLHRGRPHGEAGRCPGAAPGSRRQT